MTVRAVEWKQPYTWWKAIEITDDKVINLRLRDENNLIIYDAWDNEIYVDLQLPDEITPTDAFPVWVNTGRVIVDNWWDVQGTIIVAKTTSGDNIKILYADDGKLYMDNGTWSFKQIYFKADVDLIVDSLQAQIDVLSGLGKFLSLWDCATGEPISFPLETPYEYSTWDWYMINNVDNTTNYRPSWTEYDWTASSTVETDWIDIWDVYIYDGTVWLLQKNAGTGWWSVTFAQILWQPTDNTNLATALNWKQATLVSGTNIKTVNNNSLLGSGDITVGWEVWISSDTGNLLSTWADLWFWTESDFSSIVTKDSNTMYIQYKSDSTPSYYTITGSTQIGSTFTTTGTDIQWCYISPDGTNVYLSFWTTSNVIQYSLSTPRDLSSASLVTSISVTQPDGVCFSLDGTYMYICCENPQSIKRYVLSTPWDLSTASYDQSLSTGSWIYPANVSISDDGTQIYYAWQQTWSSMKAVSFDLSTPYDLTTATNQKILDSNNWSYKAGNYIYLLESGINQYELEDPTDITSTQTLVWSYAITSGMSEPRAMAFFDDWRYWTYGSGLSNLNLYEAQLSN